MASKLNVQSEIDLLSELERGEVTTQMSLAKRVSVSVGLINALLKRAIKKGFVKAKVAPAKRYAYYLTPTGFREKSRLVAEYLDVSLEFFRKARTEYSALFGQAEARGWTRLCLAGSGELVEIALLAARHSDVDIVALIDREHSGPDYLGVPVVSSLTMVAFDAAVIVESRAPQSTYDLLCDCVEDQRILAPAFLRISKPASDSPSIGHAMAGSGR